jgi:hypothetical protein
MEMEEVKLDILTCYDVEVPELVCLSALQGLARVSIGYCRRTRVRAGSGLRSWCI